MSQLKESLQSLDQSEDVYIYILRDFNPRNEFDVFRFSNVNVGWGGKIHMIPVTHKAIEIASTGPTARLEVSVGDPSGMISALINEIEGLEGASLKIIKTRFRFTDSGSTPDTSAILQECDYTISRIVNYVPWDTITVEGTSPVEYGGAQLPARFALRTCTFSYRQPEIGCPYAGQAMFDLTNNPTTDPTKDECSKTLAGCRVRFPNQVLPTGAFPSLSRR